MNKQQLMEQLIKYNIDTNIVCYNDTLRDDVFCVMDNYGGVDVFYRERGREFDFHRFTSESEALEYLLKKILLISGKNKELL